jgi:hypothetical protein
MLFPRGFQESSNLHFFNCSLRGAATGGSHWAWQQWVSWEWPDEGWSTKVPMEKVEDPLVEQDPRLNRNCYRVGQDLICMLTWEG